MDLLPYLPPTWIGHKQTCDGWCEKEDICSGSSRHEAVCNSSALVLSMALHSLIALLPLTSFIQCSMSGMNMFLLYGDNTPWPKGRRLYGSLAYSFRGVTGTWWVR